MPDKVFVKELRAEEHIEMCKAYQKFAFSRFPSYLDKKKKIPVKKQKELLSDLVDEFGDMFSKNPAVAEKAQQKLHLSQKKPDYPKNRIYLNYDSEDVGTLWRTVDIDQFNRSRTEGKKAPRLSGFRSRFLIFSLEILGFYNRPPEVDRQLFYKAVMSGCFSHDMKSLENSGKAINASEEDSENIDSGKGDQLEEPNTDGLFSEEQIKDLIGTYQVFRLSFNNSFEGNIATYTMRIFRDKNDPHIPCYSTFNQYQQYQPSSPDSALSRTRQSNGHIYNYQKQVLFLGGVTYSHMKETEDDRSNYPELQLMHTHGGDTLNFRGLIMAHLPFLSLPVATSIYIRKLPDKVSDELGELESILVAYKEALEEEQEMKRKRKQGLIADSEDQPEKVKPPTLTPRQIELVSRFFGTVSPDSEKMLARISSRLKKAKKRVRKAKKENESTDLASVNKLKHLQGRVAELKGEKQLHREVAKVRKYVVNRLESKYSNMLTP